jgi:hypothetical protein
MIKRFLTLAGVLTILLSGLQAQTFTNDISLTKVKMPEYAQFSEKHVMGVFKNAGTDSLFNMDIFWQANEGRIYNYHKDNFAIKSGQNWIFTCPDKVNFNSSRDYVIKVWLANPNGLPDENPLNDTIYHTVQVIEKFPERKILLEEITGAWCGYCPRAPIIVDKTIIPRYPQVIMVAIHTGDAMTISESNSLRNAYVTGVPTGFVSRAVVGGYSNVALSPESWEGRLDDLDLEFNPVELSVYNYYYPETREWKVDVVADFVLDTEGDFRMNCYVIEDSLSGTGSQWDQRNFFNNSASDPFMELKGAGDPLRGYIHNHVVRKMTGGSWGQDGIIPDSVKRGERYVYSQTFTVPNKWEIENLHLIGIIQKYSSNIADRPILNAEEAELSYATGTKPQLSSNLIKLYPNPATVEAWLEIESSESGEYSVEVLSIVGQTILKIDKQRIEGTKIIKLNSSNWMPGIYFVKVLIGDKIKINKLVIE